MTNFVLANLQGHAEDMITTVITRQWLDEWDDICFEDREHITTDGYHFENYYEAVAHQMGLIALQIAR